MKVTLKNYQKTAVDKASTAFSQGARGFLIGDKMGLGKTIEALAIAEALPKKHNLIAVVCPAFVAPKWRREIAEKAESKREYKFCVFTYSELSEKTNLINALRSRYDLIIFDEVHYAKSHKAERAQATLGDKGLHIVADKLLGLSGTWPPNNISDCYLWFKATQNPLAHGGFENFCRAHAAYCERTQFGLQVRGFRDSELFRQNFDPFFIAREIDDVTDEIPNGLRLDEPQDITAALEKAEIKLFGGVYDDAELIEKALETTPDFSRIAEFRKNQGLAKVAAVVDYAIEAREEFQKQIIFCYHHEVADAIFEKLGKKKIPCVKITGLNTSAEERDDILQEANKADDMTIVATIDSLREGVDATGFNLTLFAEMDWRPWALEQAEGRTRRIGQTKNVRWVYFYFSQGVDKAMRQAVAVKGAAIKKIRGVA